MNERAFITGYDIANPRRPQREHREMCKHATPLEYSVFLMVGDQRTKDLCMTKMAALIKDSEDDVRCHPLPARGFQGRVGRASLPTGIQWTGLPAAIA